MQPISSTSGTIRHRTVVKNDSSYSASNQNNHNDDDNGKKLKQKVVRNLDFFQKVERDYTVKTEHGGLITIIGYIIMSILVISELYNWLDLSQSTVENVIVDTSLGKKMQVNINITFPALACVDLHVDVMDVAGDSQINIEDTLKKRQLDINTGQPKNIDNDDEHEPANRAKTEQEKRQILLEAAQKDDYCGPCYGAKDIGDCCQTCQDVMKAYKEKRWNPDVLMGIAEQCIREGKSEHKPKRMTKGEGCNLSGYMSLNRVAGNFHIAMGEGVERDGRHIHQFLPEDAGNFNASHVIHELSFGPKVKRILQSNVLDGVSKFVTHDNGETGLFQYFIKIVPTIYKKDKGDSNTIETNRFFFTERYRPLMKHLIDDEHYDLGTKKSEPNSNWGYGAGKVAGAHSPHGHHSHSVRNAILPGVFFIYDIYPFAVEISHERVSFTHLIIRIMALVGGIYTIMGWVDGLLFEREKKNSNRNGH